MSLPHRLLALGCLLILPACSWLAKEPEKEPDAPKPTLVGRISSIPAHQRFVLIESYGKWSVPTGAVVTTRGTGGRSANLRVTGEAIGPFAAADIQAGDVLVGDAVYSLPTPKPPPTTGPTPPAAVSEETPESTPISPAE